MGDAGMQPTHRTACVAAASLAAALLAMTLTSICCRMRKLMFRVVFPFELKLCNTVEDCPDADALYDLIGVVVHVGSGPNHGKQVHIHVHRRNLPT